ncbi:SAM-dependent methyltransferase [Nocardia jiangxiensis]|uniref:SAM-dependent methyltransferase n=1 Tax=Nocardia jiangxiensis TaxID=282685 RepID=A0ABW6SBI1_9NOCA|nr:SAM-dependent methyltransferase [Nocardia jiangxiensis]
MTTDDDALNVNTAHTARVYDYYLGGKDHFKADRVAGEHAEQVHPHVRTSALENRKFMLRAVRHLAGQGVRQFLDIGTGIPTEPNLHQAAQEVAPAARVVYVDNDSLVLSHARALMTGTDEGRTTYVHADVRQPDSILTAPELLDTLDLSQPVAVSVIALAHFLDDPQDPFGIVAELMAAVPAGSYLVMSHATADFGPEMGEVARVYRESGMTAQVRTGDEFARFFSGLDLIDPGITTPHRWHPDIDPSEAMDGQVQFYAGVARKN